MFGSRLKGSVRGALTGTTGISLLVVTMLLAVYGGALAYLTGYATISVIVVIGALIAGLSQGLLMLKTPTIPSGSTIPLITLVVFVAYAIIAVLEFVLGQTTYEASTAIAGALLFVTTLQGELVQWSQKNYGPSPPPSGALPVQNPAPFVGVAAAFA